MASNKRMSQKPKQSAQALLKEPKARARKPESLKDKARDLENSVHRLEVEIAATSRRARESRLQNRNTLPPPDRQGFAQSQRRLTYAQSREKRNRFLMQVLEFTVTAVLFVGACAWLYQWWLSRSVE